jgi:hypothetical protein
MENGMEGVYPHQAAISDGLHHHENRRLDAELVEYIEDAGSDQIVAVIEVQRHCGRMRRRSAGIQAQEILQRDKTKVLRQLSQVVAEAIDLESEKECSLRGAVRPHPMIDHDGDTIAEEASGGARHEILNSDAGKVEQCRLGVHQNFWEGSSLSLRAYDI